MAATHHLPRAGGGLSFMQKLSPRVYLLRPSSDNMTTTSRTNDPALIIVFGWMNAGGGPIAKYVRQYQALFPTSPLLLVGCTFAGMTIPWLGLREARIAATTARTILDQDRDQERNRSDVDAPARPRLLIHAFSNAGSTMLYHLYTAFAATSSPDIPENTILPSHVTVFDSTPAPFAYQTLMQGILDAAPSAAARVAVMPIAYLYVALVWLVVTVLRVPDHIGDLGPRAHNDPARVREALRVYIYGPVDRITPAAAVDKHADEAEARGFRVWREVFEGSGHVAHARKDADRYWRIVRQTWETGLGARIEARL